MGQTPGLAPRGEPQAGGTPTQRPGKTAELEVLQTESGSLHLLLSTPLGAAVLKPDLEMERNN